MLRGHLLKKCTKRSLVQCTSCSVHRARCSECVLCTVQSCGTMPVVRSGAGQNASTCPTSSQCPVLRLLPLNDGLLGQCGGDGAYAQRRQGQEAVLTAPATVLQPARIRIPPFPCQYGVTMDCGRPLLFHFSLFVWQRSSAWREFRCYSPCK